MRHKVRYVIQSGLELWSLIINTAVDPAQLTCPLAARRTTTYYASLSQAPPVTSLIERRHFVQTNFGSVGIDSFGCSPTATTPPLVRMQLSMNRELSSYNTEIHCYIITALCIITDMPSAFCTEAASWRPVAF